MVMSSGRDISPQFDAQRSPFYVPPPANFLPLLNLSRSEVEVPECEGELPGVEEGELNEDEEEEKGREVEGRDVSAAWMDWLNSSYRHEEEEEDDEQLEAIPVSNSCSAPPEIVERLKALSGLFRCEIIDSMC
jgi:hypothetical protein